MRKAFNLGEELIGARCPLCPQCQLDADKHSTLSSHLSQDCSHSQFWLLEYTAKRRAFREQNTDMSNAAYYGLYRTKNSGKADPWSCKLRRYLI